MISERLIDARTIVDIRKDVGPSRVELEPSRCTVYPCGCEHRCVQYAPVKMRWALCSYHEGFDDGLEASRLTR